MFVFFFVFKIMQSLTRFVFFKFQKSSDFPYPDKICENCLNDLRIVCDFKRRCEVACDQLMLLSAEADTKLDQPQISYENNTILIENTLPSIEVVEICPIEAYIEPVKFEVFCDDSFYDQIFFFNYFHSIE